MNIILRYDILISKLLFSDFLNKNPRFSFSISRFYFGHIHLEKVSERVSKWVKNTHIQIDLKKQIETLNMLINSTVNTLTS